jgi:hypothetical protein
MSHRSIEFQVLGPTEARQGAKPIPLSGARLRALVTRLLFEAGRAVADHRTQGDEVLARSEHRVSEPSATQRVVILTIESLRRRAAAASTKTRIFRRPCTAFADPVSPNTHLTYKQHQ